MQSYSTYRRFSSKQNVRETKEAVEALKAINPAILVEGEIGDIGTGSEIHEEMSRQPGALTTPEEAKQYVDSTGIDILAPAVGNMHGMLKIMVQGETRKHLDSARIAEIKSATGIFLTLHGGSGTDDKDFLKAIAAGINIVHINTELRVAWRRGLEQGLAKNPDEVVPYKILPLAVELVKQVTRSRRSSLITDSNSVRNTRTQKAPQVTLRGFSILFRRSPNLPRTCARSTIGPARLNFRVRDGNGWDPRSMVTGNLRRRLTAG